MQQSQNLNNLIAKSECSGLNIEGDNQIGTIFENNNQTIKSIEGDATMIINIKFKEKVNLNNLQIDGVDKEHNPSLMKCYVNKSDIDFSDVDDVPSTQTFKLNDEMGKKLKLNIPKWRNVSELILYFQNEEADFLEIKSIQCFGNMGGVNINIGEMKKGEDENYVPIKGKEESNNVFDLKPGESLDSFFNKYPNKYIFVDFHAKWCGPCKKLGPVLEQKASIAGAIVLKIDVDKHNAIAEKFNISSIPRVFLYKNGEKLYDMTGFDPNALDEAIKIASS